MSTLALAVPSKGRLQENAEAFFARAGLKLVKPRGAREYRGAIAGMPEVEVAYLSASDITTQLGQGSVHLGVTGEDQVGMRVHQARRNYLALRVNHLDAIVARLVVLKKRFRVVIGTNPDDTSPVNSQSRVFNHLEFAAGSGQRLLGNGDKLSYIAYNSAGLNLRPDWIRHGWLVSFVFCNQLPCL